MLCGKKRRRVGGRIVRDMELGRVLGRGGARFFARVHRNAGIRFGIHFRLLAVLGMARPQEGDCTLEEAVVSLLLHGRRHVWNSGLLGCCVLFLQGLVGVCPFLLNFIWS